MKSSQLLDIHTVDTHHQIAIMTQIDDSGYLRYDIVVDTATVIADIALGKERQEEPLGILVFLDDTKRIGSVTQGFETAIDAYDRYKIIHTIPSLNLYHRLVLPTSPIRGTELLRRFIGYVKQNLSYKMITSHETNQVSVIKWLLKNHFDFIFEKDRIQWMSGSRNQKVQKNIYGYVEQDMIFSDTGIPINFPMRYTLEHK